MGWVGRGCVGKNPQTRVFVFGVFVGTSRLCPPFSFPTSILFNCVTPCPVILTHFILLQITCPERLPVPGMSEGTRIQFDDAIHPTVSQSGGVYNLRERAGSGTGNIRAPSLTKQTSKEYDLEKEVSNVEERDIRKKQVRNSTLAIVGDS